MYLSYIYLYTTYIYYQQCPNTTNISKNMSDFYMNYKLSRLELKTRKITLHTMAFFKRYLSNQNHKFPDQLNVSKIFKDKKSTTCKATRTAPQMKKQCNTFSSTDNILFM